MRDTSATSPPPCLHAPFGFPGVRGGPLKVMRDPSATPCTSTSTSTALIEPVGTGRPAAASDCGVNVYVTEPSGLIVGVTLLQPRKYVVPPATTSNRGEPPWHWLALASGNEAGRNVFPPRPPVSAPGAAFVALGPCLAEGST